MANESSAPLIWDTGTTFFFYRTELLGCMVLLLKVCDKTKWQIFIHLSNYYFSSCVFNVYQMCTKEATLCFFYLFLTLCTWSYFMRVHEFLVRSTKYETEALFLSQLSGNNSWKFYLKKSRNVFGNVKFHQLRSVLDSLWKKLDKHLGSKKTLTDLSRIFFWIMMIGKGLNCKFVTKM